MHASLLHRRACYSSAKSIQSASLLGRSSRRTQIFTPSSSLCFSPSLAPSPAFRRPFSTPPSALSQKPREASSGWAITFTVLVVCVGAWLQDKYRGSRTDPSSQLTESEPPKLEHQDDLFLGVIDTLETMPIEAAPGTVGNLTPEQEIKLQEMWVLLFKVCGVQMDGIEETERPPSPVQEKKQPAKRGFSLWGGSSQKSEPASTEGATSGLESLSITDGDDKFGTSKEFQKALAEIKPEDIRTSFWNMVKQDDPDSLLLRFLRARKWDVKKALMMLISTLRWRMLEAKVDEDIMVNGEALAVEQSKSSNPAEKKKGEDFMKQFRMGKSFLHGVDKQGRPICYVRVRLHRAGDQETEALDRFTVFTIESARMMLAPPVETACVIFDMTEFGLANMDYQPVKFMIKCFEANYPESLGVVLIHKAPWLFSSIWSVIKGWLDPVVAQKIHFTKNAQDLEEFIPRSRLISELEGDEKFEYKYIEPKAGENEKLKETAKRDELIAERQKISMELQESTVAWILASRKKEEDKTKEVTKQRKDLIERLRVHYWQLDPYVRATSLYDRSNIIQGGGKIEFYPEASKGTETATNGEAAKTD